MKPQNAAALVAAGMLSVLIYPLIGLRWLEKGSKATGRPGTSEPTPTHGPPSADIADAAGEGQLS